MLMPEWTRLECRVRTGVHCARADVHHVSRREHRDVPREPALPGGGHTARAALAIRGRPARSHPHLRKGS